MPRILYDPTSGALINWPRQDDEDVVGLQPPVVMLTIEQQPQPDYDPSLYGLEPTRDVDLDAGVLRCGWALRPIPAPPPVAQWLQFAGTLLGSDDVKALLWAAEAVNPGLRDMLSVGLGQAADGKLATFLTAWGQARAGGLIPQELAEQVAAMAAAFDLPAEFVEALS